MRGVWIKVRTAWALGLGNIARVAAYRAGVRLGINPVRRLQAAVPRGDFWGPVSLPPLVFSGAGSSVVGSGFRPARLGQLFSRWPVDVNASPPDWLANPLSGQHLPGADRPWWQIPDFDAAVGDIKLIWEWSRMDWVLALAQRAKQGDGLALDQLNEWLLDWCTHNPPYLGPNWKCGQEASIRVMHVAMASVVLGQVRTAQPGLRDWVALHLQRIAPTVQYAMAQDNNHGTSEAAALFMGGSWLDALGDARGAKWAAAGRKLLENRAARLIGEQGTFSQYSVNYHRVMLDTFCMAECWRLHLGLPAFSAVWQQRACAASRWLFALTDPETGDAPNVGANDGARLLQLTDSAYRDHRPSVQLALALFAGERAYAADGPWCDVLAWLGVPLPTKVSAPAASLQADDGGFMVMRLGACMALLRYPRFRFRPSQCDALHLDLWRHGQCLMGDAGTYSYNTDAPTMAYFGGVAGHNTVQFDGRDQMPRLGRFLWGDWLKTRDLEPLRLQPDGVRAGAGYRDGLGAEHHRQVHLHATGVQVTDRVRGFGRSAVLRWRLAPGNWVPCAAGADTAPGFCRFENGQGHSLTVRADVAFVRCEWVQGWESLHYLEKTPVHVLELEIDQPGTWVTHYDWAA